MEAEKVYLVATDFSPSARSAAFRAARLGAERRNRLALLHVLSAPLLSSLKSLLGVPTDVEDRVRHQAIAELQTLTDELHLDAGMEAYHRVVTGEVAEEIAAAAQGAELLALGGSGPTWRDRLLGSVAERVMRRFAGPLLIVKQWPETTYQRVLVPVAFGPFSLNALAAAAYFAPKADVTVLHAFTLPFEKSLALSGLPEEQIAKHRETAHFAALDRLEELIGTFGVAGSRYHRSVEYGAAAPSILAKEAQLGCDLIVMGRQGDSSVEEILLGSVTRQLLYTSNADVLVVGRRPVGPGHD